MTREKAIDIIKAERACVERQGRTGECCRDDLGCGACDLVMEDKDIIEAYDMAIKALKEETICPILSDDEVKQPCIKSPCGIEQSHGVWKVIHNALGETKYQCNQCQHYVNFGDDKNFCPNCGSDNRKRSEAE